MNAAWTVAKYGMLAAIVFVLSWTSGCNLGRGITKDINDASGFILRHTKPTDEKPWWIVGDN